MIFLEDISNRRGADKEDKNKKLDNSLNVYFNVSSV